MDNAYDLRGFKRAQVVKTYVNGTLGVFVPACMRASNHKPDADEDKNKKSVANASGIFHEDSPFKISNTECKDNNFMLIIYYKIVNWFYLSQSFFNFLFTASLVDSIFFA